MQTLNREAWLGMMTEQYIKPHFQAKGYTIPENVRMSCAFTSRGASGKRIGECWSNKSSEDNTFEIFIHPAISDSNRVADILIHELVHATVGLQAGHGKSFKQCATSVGLTGKMTATIATEELKAIIEQWIAELGQYPHATLSSNGIKKQSTRMIKCVCSKCDYQVYTSKKWIEVSIPVCPDVDCEAYNWNMTVNLPEDLDE
jgi:hypothetical protein